MCSGPNISVREKLARVEGAQSACAETAFFGPKHEDGSELVRTAELNGVLWLLRRRARWHRMPRQAKTAYHSLSSSEKRIVSLGGFIISLQT